MATNTMIKKIGQDVSDLKKDMATIKAVIFDTDSEGEYKEFFVRKILRRAKDKASYAYRDKQSFLSHVRDKAQD
ncbi:MAG: hypothetical protein AAB730_01525 [Patescibacteria group bacterium]